MPTMVSHLLTAHHVQRLQAAQAADAMWQTGYVCRAAHIQLMQAAEAAKVVRQASMAFS